MQRKQPVSLFLLFAGVGAAIVGPRPNLQSHDLHTGTAIVGPRPNLHLMTYTNVGWALAQQYTMQGAALILNDENAQISAQPIHRLCH